MRNRKAALRALLTVAGVGLTCLALLRPSTLIAKASVFTRPGAPSPRVTVRSPEGNSAHPHHYLVGSAALTVHNASQGSGTPTPSSETSRFRLKELANKAWEGKKEHWRDEIDDLRGVGRAVRAAPGNAVRAMRNPTGRSNAAQAVARVPGKLAWGARELRGHLGRVVRYSMPSRLVQAAVRGDVKTLRQLWPIYKRGAIEVALGPFKIIPHLLYDHYLSINMWAVKVPITGAVGVGLHNLGVDVFQVGVASLTSVSLVRWMHAAFKLRNVPFGHEARLKEYGLQSGLLFEQSLDGLGLVHLPHYIEEVAARADLPDASKQVVEGAIGLHDWAIISTKPLEDLLALDHAEDIPLFDPPQKRLRPTGETAIGTLKRGVARGYRKTEPARRWAGSRARGASNDVRTTLTRGSAELAATPARLRVQRTERMVQRVAREARHLSSSRRARRLRRAKEQHRTAQNRLRDLRETTPDGAWNRFVHRRRLESARRAEARAQEGFEVAQQRYYDGVDLTIWADASRALAKRTRRQSRRYKSEALRQAADDVHRAAKGVKQAEGPDATRNAMARLQRANASLRDELMPKLNQERQRLAQVAGDPGVVRRWLRRHKSSDSLEQATAHREHMRQYAGPFSQNSTKRRMPRPQQAIRSVERAQAQVQRSLDAELHRTWLNDGARAVRAALNAGNSRAFRNLNHASARRNAAVLADERYLNTLAERHTVGSAQVQRDLTEAVELRVRFADQYAEATHGNVEAAMALPQTLRQLYDLERYFD